MKDIVYIIIILSIIFWGYNQKQLGYLKAVCEFESKSSVIHNLEDYEKGYREGFCKGADWTRKEHNINEIP